MGPTSATLGAETAAFAMAEAPMVQIPAGGQAPSVGCVPSLHVIDPNTDMYDFCEHASMAHMGAGFRATGMQKLFMNQGYINTAIHNIDGSANAARAQQSAAECAQAASLCAQGVERVGTAEEVTAAAAPIMEELKAIRAENAAMKTKLDAVEKKQNEACCIIS